jgi:hypothetical protein
MVLIKTTFLNFHSGLLKNDNDIMKTFEAVHKVRNAILYNFYALPPLRHKIPVSGGVLFGGNVTNQ